MILVNEALELPLHAQMSGDRGGRAPLDERTTGPKAQGQDGRWEMARNLERLRQKGRGLECQTQKDQSRLDPILPPILVLLGVLALPTPGPATFPNTACPMPSMP